MPEISHASSDDTAAPNNKSGGVLNYIRTLLTSFLKTEGTTTALVYILLVLIFMILAPAAFLGYRTYMAHFAAVSPPLIIALGLTFVIIAGEMDLSFPATIAASGFVFSWIFKFQGDPLVALSAALTIGVLLGLMNGVLVTMLGLPSFIITLATLFLWGGMVVVISNGLSISIPSGVDTSVFHILTGRIYGFPVQFLWAISVAVLMWFILNRHRFGESLLFMGDNPEVARVLGISIDVEKLKLFTMMGLVSSFAGVILTLESNNYFSNQGMGYLLIVVSGVFIGGTSIFGGSGTIVGTVFGSLIVGIIEIGLVASGFQGFWTHVLIGAVFILSVTISTVLEDPNRVPLVRWLRGQR
jgi:simple sugar transport system permease protein